MTTAALKMSTLAAALLAVAGHGLTAAAGALDALKEQAPGAASEISVPAVRAVPVAASAADSACASEEALDIKDRAQVATWNALLILQQHKKLFSRSAGIRVESLPFWREDGHNASIKALRMAQSMDDVFRGLDGAKRRDDGAVFILAKALTSGKDSGRDMKALAGVIAALYDFPAFASATPL